MSKYQYFSVNFPHKKYGYSVFAKIETDGYNVTEEDARDYVIDHEMMDAEDAKFAYIEEITEIEYKDATI